MTTVRHFSRSERVMTTVLQVQMEVEVDELVAVEVGSTDPEVVDDEVGRIFVVGVVLEEEVYDDVDVGHIVVFEVIGQG